MLVPLNLTASLCFEQSYGGVDGDSASAAELYALLSSLAGVPLRQDLAVTGSINQKGEIQPVGGVSAKIEGFYLACKAKGLTGKQGVIIPAKNKKSLMLKQEVVEAVDKGRFHIYTIDTVDDGIELLSGLKPGKLTQKGTFRKGSFNKKVLDQLEKFNATLSKKMGPEAAGENDRNGK